MKLHTMSQTKFYRPLVIVLLVTFLALAGCSGLNTTEQRVLSGTAIGAGAGTLGAAASGGSLFGGAALGAAAGALGGFLFDRLSR